MLPENPKENSSENPKENSSRNQRDELKSSRNQRDPLVEPQHHDALLKASKVRSLLLERLLSVKRIAELAEMSKRTVRRAIHDGTLKSLDIGRGKTPVYRIPYFWYLQWIANKLPGGVEEYLEAYEEFQQEEAVEGLELLAKKYQKLLKAEGKDEIKEVLKDE